MEIKIVFNFFRYLLCWGLNDEILLSDMAIELVEKGLEVDWLFDRLKSRGLEFSLKVDDYDEVSRYSLNCGCLALFIWAYSNKQVASVTVCINRNVTFRYVEGFLKRRGFRYHSKLESSEIAFKRDGLFAVLNGGGDRFSFLFTLDEKSALVREKIQIRCGSRGFNDKVLPQPAFELNERVSPLKYPGKVGIVNFYHWHSKNERYYYHLFIDGRYRSKRYYEEELVRLEQGDEKSMKFRTINDWLCYVSEAPISDLTFELFEEAFDFDAILNRAAGGEVDRTTLDKVEKRLRKRDIEEAFWQLTLKYLPQDCLDDGLLELGHLNLDDKWLLKLAGRVEEAAVTLGKRYYIDDNYGVGDFAALLERFTASYWLFSSLISLENVVKAKRKVLLKILFRSTDFDDLKELVVESNIYRYLKKTGSVDDIKRYYKTGNPLYLKAIASNAVTPDEILDKLTTTKQIKYARQIRERANDNIKRKKQ